jgi:hypothetical protein
MASDRWLRRCWRPEPGDITRFDNHRQLMAYLGLVVP